MSRGRRVLWGPVWATMHLFRAWLCVAALVLALALVCRAQGTPQTTDEDDMRKGYDISETGLVPVYPAGRRCPKLTSFYASWIDVDGLRRDEIHTGVDGGKLGDWILAPAAGTVRAVWEADWGWGKEGALLLLHTAADVTMTDSNVAFYYSAFDHLSFAEISSLKEGQKIARGQRLARVQRPGGNPSFLPEVHWEVWEAKADKLQWETNRHGGSAWRNPRARLIDPLYMLGVHAPPQDGSSVEIVPFDRDRDYARFRGFTYIFECPKE